MVLGCFYRGGFGITLVDHSRETHNLRRVGRSEDSEVWLRVRLPIRVRVRVWA